MRLRTARLDRLSRAAMLVLTGLFVLTAVPLARPQQPPSSPVAQLLQKLESAIKSGDASRYRNLLAPGADDSAAASFARSVIREGATRVVVRERDRAPLTGVPSGEGYRVLVDVFSEFDRRASLSTWTLDVVRPRATNSDGPLAEWAVRSQAVVSTFGPFYSLVLGARQFQANNLVITSEDLELRLPTGAVFTAETDQGPTVLLLVGRGQVVFRPTPETEREQMKIFADSETLDTSFTAAFVRVSPSSLESHIARGTMTERSADRDAARTADEVFRTDSVKSYGVNLADLTSGSWSLVPGGDDFLAELHTKKFGVLTYARSSHQAEDITLFDRQSRHNISVYASKERLARRGPFYDDDEGEDYDVVHYDIDATLDPEKSTISGVARLTVRVRTDTTNLSLKLAESLTPDSVISREFGRLVAIPVVNQNSFLVNLPKNAPKGAVLGLTIAYHGRIIPHLVDREAIAVQAPQDPERDDSIPLEPSYLYSNRSYWYPQGDSGAYATASLRVKVPPGYSCVASGDPAPGTPELIGAENPSRAPLVFQAFQPVRYLSVLVTRLVRVSTQMVGTAADLASAKAVEPTSESSGEGAYYHDIELTSFATPRMRGRAESLSERAADILRFYASLMRDCPYPTLTLAVVERELPGGHSPAYLAVLSQPVFGTRYDWRNDPTSFAQFPEFFLSHEIAHQWWGQAVGWKNYHEQWLSEGLSQYFAALYAEHLRGKDVFDGIVRKLQDWAVRKSNEGPVYLGYRIGHVKRDPQLFRAVVYNKSAAVLHMLRRLIGDDAFFAGLRRFYRTWRFKKAGSDDLRLAFEAESGRSLSRFFDRWIYDSRLPRLKFTARTERDAATGRDVEVVRFEQTGNVFDIPVTVTLDYTDRSPVDVIVQVTDAVTEARLPLEGKLRGVEVNRDRAAVAKIEK